MDVLDSVGMFDLAAALPDQVAAAAQLDADLDRLPGHDDIEHVVVLGMGGSGVGGEVVRAVAGPFLPVPLTIAKGYEAPSFASEGTLCFAVSFSGDTEETVEAAQAAAAAGAHIVALSRGGQLGDLAAAWDAPHIVLPDLPMPRAGIGAVSIPMLLVLERVGLFPGAAQYVADAVDQLRRRRDELIVDGSVAHRLAAEIGRTIPLAYGGGAVGEVAAYRF
jgi:glucose/mannose-6-phosphate isomerase